MSKASPETKENFSPTSSPLAGGLDSTSGSCVATKADSSSAALSEASLTAPLGAGPPAAKGKPVNTLVATEVATPDSNYPSRPISAPNQLLTQFPPFGCAFVGGNSAVRIAREGRGTAAEAGAAASLKSATAAASAGAKAGSISRGVGRFGGVGRVGEEGSGAAAVAAKGANGGGRGAAAAGKEPVPKRGILGWTWVEAAGRALDRGFWAFGFWLDSFITNHPILAGILSAPIFVAAFVLAGYGLYWFLVLLFHFLDPDWDAELREQTFGGKDRARLLAQGEAHSAELAGLRGDMTLLRGQLAKLQGSCYTFKPQVGGSQFLLLALE